MVHVPVVRGVSVSVGRVRTLTLGAPQKFVWTEHLGFVLIRFSFGLKFLVVLFIRRIKSTQPWAKVFSKAQCGMTRIMHIV